MSKYILAYGPIVLCCNELYTDISFEDYENKLSSRSKEPTIRSNSKERGAAASLPNPFLLRIKTEPRRTQRGLVNTIMPFLQML